LGRAIVARLISDLDGSPAYEEVLQRHSRYVARATGAEQDGLKLVELELEPTQFLIEFSGRIRGLFSVQLGPWFLQHSVYRIQFRREAGKWEALNRKGSVS
jgi:hypothetical protein